MLSCLSYLSTVLCFLFTYFQAHLLRHFFSECHSSFVQPVPAVAAPIAVSFLLHGCKWNLTNSFLNGMLIISRSAAGSSFLLVPELQQRDCSHPRKKRLCSHPSSVELRYRKFSLIYYRVQEHTSSPLKCTAYSKVAVASVRKRKFLLSFPLLSSLMFYCCYCFLKKKKKSRFNIALQLLSFSTTTAFELWNVNVGLYH